MPAKKTTTEDPKIKPEFEKKASKFTPEVLIAITGLVSTIITAVLAPILIDRWKSSIETPIATTEIPTVQATDTQVFITPTLGFTPVVSPGDFVDPKGVVMAYVPAGNFIMGGNNGDDDEKPPHE